MQLRFFRNAVRNDSVPSLPELEDAYGVNYTLSVECLSEETDVYKRIDDVIVPKADLLKSGWITFSSAKISALFSEAILRGREKITFKVEVSVRSPRMISTLSCARNRTDPLALEFLKIKEDSRLTFLNQLQSLDFNRTEFHRMKRQETSKCDNSLTEEDILSECHLENLTIPFSLFGFGEGVIPASYNAGYCTGGCNFPLSTSIVNFHSYVQAYVAFMLDPNISSPSCVPTNYTSAQALVRGEHDVYDIHVFVNISATECGCR